MQEGSSRRILKTWLALELLEAGAPYDKPSDLANGSSRVSLPLDDSLPWEAAGFVPPQKPGKTYYEVVLGSIRLDASYDLLYRSFPDAKPDRTSSKRFAPLATFLLDDAGALTAGNDITISSFCWAYPKALRKDFSTLYQWSKVSMRLKENLAELLERKDEEGKPLPVTAGIVGAAYAWLVEELGLEPELCVPPSFAFRIRCDASKKDTPELLLLNSFYLDDLSLAIKLRRKGDLPPLVSWYLGERGPQAPIDILNASGALEGILAPMSFPLARWPSPGRFPLACLQQAAVNLARQAQAGEILAVNGPPGTGKTTLIRDVVAMQVTARAVAMVEFDDPEEAFKRSDVELPLGTYTVHPYSVGERLRGYEMIVASSNNKAVENVSRELPGLRAIAEDATSLRYFKHLSDAVLGSETWGLVAAVLGNSANRNSFKNSFWFNPDTGLQVYLQFIEGSRRYGSKSSIPSIIASEDPPLNHTEALARWREARDRFNRLKEAVENIKRERECLRRLMIFLPELSAMVLGRERSARARPCLLKRIFRTPGFRAWRMRDNAACDDFRLLKEEYVNLGLTETILSCIQAARLNEFWKPSRYAAVSEDIDALRSGIDAKLSALGCKPFTEEEWNERRDSAQVVGPWFSEGEHRLRDELFQSALSVHRAFIDAAAGPLKTNLMFALKLFDGDSLTGISDALTRDLISSFFFVVPCVSTTFASVGRMLGSLPSETIGWLIVDEAGQAKPQQAVGALARSKRALIVGDPMQVPPVVGIPESLVRAIADYFKVDSPTVCAPYASVQTMSDRSNTYVAKFSAAGGQRAVGVPLLVHRRCSEPMFSISNRIAYENQMVLAKRESASPIKSRLGPSRWIHMQGSGSNKWCEEEGTYVLRRCEELAIAGIALDIYIVTPFVQVAEGLRTLFRSSGIFQGAVTNLPVWVHERIGTVHTVQGREAEAVFFVLGAPNENQRGARAWAGASPNLINVAATRAKECLYVIGNAELWRTAGLFGDLHYLLERESLRTEDRKQGSKLIQARGFS